jgi:hypothetical protein
MGSVTLDVRGSVGVGTLDVRGSVGVGTLDVRGSVGVGTLDARGSVGVGTLDARGSVGVGTLLKVDFFLRSIMDFKVSPTVNLGTTELSSFIMKSLSIEKRAGSRA